jgi:hypothetical protein
MPNMRLDYHPGAFNRLWKRVFICILETPWSFQVQCHDVFFPFGWNKHADSYGWRASFFFCPTGLIFLRYVSTVAVIHRNLIGFAISSLTQKRKFVLISQRHSFLLSRHDHEQCKSCKIEHGRLQPTSYTRARIWETLIRQS